MIKPYLDCTNNKLVLRYNKVLYYTFVRHRFRCQCKYRVSEVQQMEFSFGRTKRFCISR